MYDSDGVLLGEFGDRGAAHCWARHRAAQPGTRLPLAVQDRDGADTVAVWSPACRVRPTR